MDTGTGRQLDIVKVARSTLLTNAPLAIGDEEGDFAREGIALQYVEVPSLTTQSLPSLQSGDIDVLSSVVSIGLINAIAGQATFRIVADRGFVDPRGCETFGIVGRRAHFGDRPINASALRGTRVSTNAVGQSGYLMSRFLALHGLKLSDIEVVRLPPSVEPTAMDKGTIDVVTRGDPHLTSMLARGHRLLAGATTISPGSHLAVLVYGPSLLERNRDLGLRFMRGYLNAVRRYNGGRTERNAGIVSRRLGLDSAALLKMCWPAARADGAINRASLIDYQKWAAEGGELARVIDPEMLVDPEFATRATAQLDRKK